jgi:tetratricopeptide (TPR) repeat protein
MDDIDQYLEVARLKLKILSGTDQTQAKYRYAQLCVSLGRHDDALPYLQEAFGELERAKGEEGGAEGAEGEWTWTRLYCSVGVQYASCLDYKAQYDDAGVVFGKIMAVDPVGYHLGDYALFLHRRKRDFERAQG